MKLPKFNWLKLAVGLVWVGMGNASGIFAFTINVGNLPLQIWDVCMYTIMLMIGCYYIAESVPKNESS